jgi:hypothetical protein
MKQIICQIFHRANWIRTKFTGYTGSSTTIKCNKCKREWQPFFD